jgi:hypothetical protein
MSSINYKNKFEQDKVSEHSLCERHEDFRKFLDNKSMFKIINEHFLFLDDFYLDKSDINSNFSKTEIGWINGSYNSKNSNQSNCALINKNDKSTNEKHMKRNTTKFLTSHLNSLRREIIISDEIEDRNFNKTDKIDSRQVSSSTLCSNSHSTNISMINESPSSSSLNSNNTYLKFSISNFNIEVISDINIVNHNLKTENIHKVIDQELNSYKIQNENLKLNLEILKSENDVLKSKLKLAIENAKFQVLYTEKCKELEKFEKIIEEVSVKFNTFLEKINYQNLGLIDYRNEINQIFSNFIETFSEIREIGEIKPRSKIISRNKNNPQATDDFYLNSQSSVEEKEITNLTSIKKLPNTIDESLTHSPIKLNTVSKKINFNDVKSINSEKVILFLK